MEDFLVFFLGIFVFFTVCNKIYKKGDIVSIRSKVDGKIYVVRKLPDAKQAADKLAVINNKVLKLISSVDTSKEGTQDLIDNYKQVTIFLISGIKLEGTITSSDVNTITLKGSNNIQLVYKHAISTILPV